MEIKITKEDKTELIFTINNQTVAELIRVYLNEDKDVDFAAWRKEHYSKPLIFKIVTTGKDPKKVLNDVIIKIKKDVDSISEEYKKAIK